MTVPVPETESTPLPPHARFDIGPARYPKTHVSRDVPLPMRDGTVLFADLTRPADEHGPVSEPVPCVVNFTPYNKLLSRGADFARVRDFARRFASAERTRFSGRDMLHAPAGGMVEASMASPTLVSRGYAYLLVDVRGTGTSTGKWDFFGPDEQQDYLEVLRWARDQPWCDGRLALTGISYGAIAALLAAGLAPDGPAAVFAIEAGENPVRELGLTGGVPSPIMAVWLGSVTLLKWVPSIPGLVRAGAWRRYLRDRIADPAGWIWRATKIALGTDNPDIFLNDMWATKLPQFENIRIPTWIHGGWHDVYNRSNFRMYDRIATAPGPKQVLVDESYHNAPGSGFGAPDAPQVIDELQCAFFDRWVRGIDNGIDRYGPITLRQQGGGWVSRARFPAPDVAVRRLYLDPAPSGSAAHAGIDASLRDRPPAHARRLPLPGGRIPLASNNTAIISTGLATLLGRRYGSDDRTAEAVAVTFTTPPLAGDMVISGSLNLHLCVEAAGTDAFWSVTVTDVEPDGASATLTRGALLSSLRAVDEAACVYLDGELLVAEHPCTAASVLPVHPGVPFELDIDINPTEAVLKAGHRLRVAISRTSVPRHSFSRAQRKRITRQTLILTPEAPSYLTFPATTPEL